MNAKHTPRVLFLLLAAATTLPAQDPAREIQEIARRVDEQLQEIDRLLLESGKKGAPRSRPKELLEQARERGAAVEDGIDKLIEKLNEMKNQRGGGQSNDQDQQQQDQQNQDQQQQGKQQGQKSGQQQRPRAENQGPDIVDQPRGEQPQPQPGENQPKPQPSPDGQPQGGQETPDGGRNTTGNRAPDSPTGPPNPATGDGNWGELQPYMNFLRNRGSRPPQVPEKFRKYWEAYLKQKQAPGGGGKNE